MAKTLNTRIQHKTDTTANWNLATTFKPLKGELIIYDDNNGQPPKFKIGNGSSTVVNLPFATSDEVAKATKATQDANGNVITSTYATKTELTTGLNGKANSSHKHTTSDIEGLSDANTTYDLAASKSSSNGNVKLNLTAGGSGSGTDSVTIKGTGYTTVTSDANGVIVINSTGDGTGNNGASLSNDTPKAAGTAAAGTSNAASRSDHVHPVQTTVDTATKLSTATAGSTKQPVYFTDGKPAAISYTIEKSVPSNAVFTDTNTAHSHQAGTGISLSGSGGTSGTTTIGLTDSGVTAASYGPSSGGTLSHGGTFEVPYLTVDAKGRVKSASTKTFTLPSGSTPSPEPDEPDPEPSVTINPPTISISGHTLSIYIPTSGETPASYQIYFDGHYESEISRSDDIVTCNLWNLTSSKPTSVTVSVSSVAYNGVTSTRSSGKTYTNYKEASNSTTVGPDEIPPFFCSYSYQSNVSGATIVDYDMGNTSHDWEPIAGSGGVELTYAEDESFWGSCTVNVKYKATVSGSTWWVLEELTWAEECLVEGTQILMADGTSKNIEDVKAGDVLRSWDIITKTPIDVVCTASMYTGRDVSIDTMAFKGGKYLQIARAHAVYNSRVHTNFTHKKWQPGDAGKGINGEEIIFEHTSTAIHDTAVKHYTLHTENGLYYANGILCGHHITRVDRDLRRYGDKFGYTEEEIQTIAAEADLVRKEHAWSTDEKYVRIMATKPNTSDLRKQIKQAKDSLAARDYKTIKRLQGFIDDDEWAENLKICQSLRNTVNDVTKELDETVEFSRQTRVSLGYPAKIRSHGQQFRASQILLNSIIRAHQENK